MRARVLRLVLALSCIAAPALALDPATPLSEYVLTSWTEKSGLFSSLIWAIGQDRDGYLWLGTDAGLIRFDGVRFVRVDEPRLRDVRVGALLTTSDGSLWIGLNSTAALCRYQGGRFTFYTAGDGLPFSVGRILEDADGVLWAGGRGGLSRMVNGRWQRLGADEGLTSESVSGIFQDRQKAIWVATVNRLYRKAAGESRFEPVPASFHVRALADDRDGALWATGPLQAIGTPLGSSNPGVMRAWADVAGWRVMRDGSDNLWVATLGRGILRVSNTTAGAVPKVERLGSELGLSHDVVRSLFEDREGNLWVGTQHGLNRFSERTIKMLTSQSDVSPPVRAITAGTDGSVWIGTDTGVYRFADGRRTHYGRSEGLPTLVIGSLHTDRKGTIWVAAEQGGVARFDGRRFVAVTGPQHTALRRVWAITSDADDALWLCDVDNGLFRWKDGALTSFAGTPSIASHRVCAAMLTDRNGRVWTGFSDGTLAIREHDTFRILDARDGLTGGAVSALHEDASGTIWIGTAKGLVTSDGERFTVVGSQAGVAHTNVRAIAEDANRALWIGTNDGLVRIEDKDGRGPRFDMFDGLRGVPMSVGGYPAAATGGDGRLWFLTSGGVAVVDPAQAHRKRVSPPVRIEALTADETPYALDGPIELPPGTSRIQFDYTGLSLTAPSKVRFKFMLEGFDQTWVDAGARRQAFYTNLPPRSYRFRVIAENDGVWNEAGAAVALEVLPTFYQTRTFYVGLAVAVVLLIVAAWRIRVRQVHRQFALVIGERTRVAREIHDTLLQSLVGVAFQFDAASAEFDESPTSARDRLARLRTQIEAAIREARQSIWDLRSPPLEQRELPTALRELGESIAGPSVRFGLEVSGSQRRNTPRLNEALLRIAREAISNAVRHASASAVSVHLSYDRDGVTMRVTDNGRGFESASAKVADHWGLATMRERAEQLGGRLTLASAPGRGTEIEIIAPFARGQKA